jgi:hypothetical protein
MGGSSIIGRQSGGKPQPGGLRTEALVTSGQYGIADGVE